MALVSKYGLYRLVLFVWGVGVFGGVILVGSGNAEPYVSASQLPVDGPLELFGLAAGLLVLGAVVVAVLERGSWTTAGRRANLIASGGGIVRKPDLEGTIDGRTVRARTHSRRTGSGGEGGSTKTTYTVVEAELDGPATEGLVFSATGDETLSHGSVNVDLGSDATAVNGVAVVGKPDLAREVLTNRVVDAMQAPRQLETVYVGNVTDLLLDEIPDADGLVTGALTETMRSGVEAGLPGDADTVRMERNGVILDADELEAQTRAMAAVADSFEHATT